MISFIIDGKPIQVSIQPSERARKTVEIEFRSRDELIVTLPYNKDVDVEALLERHRGLIEEKYREFLSRKKILDGDTIHFKGEPYKINVNQVQNPPINRVKIEGNSLIVNIREKENPSLILKRWIGEQTEELVTQFIEYHRTQFGNPSKVFITDTERWGYCRKNGEIIFNWQLSCLPPKLAEYVILHELVHLQAFNHQNQFHVKMLNLIPDYQNRDSELKKYISIKPNFEFKTKSTS